jgi:DNA invertase Pin-like site-specific DNA recombinase
MRHRQRLRGGHIVATRANGAGFDARRPPEAPAHDAGLASTPRVAVYLRVSTGRQAEHDLSIPDQRAQAHAWVAQRGWSLAAEYVEPGASATDDKRPEFQKMIERACDGENAFDYVVVHSFSRFFRDAFGLEFYVRKLAKHGVRLVSITQELGDDPAQVMMRQVIALFDEYQSKENAKHVLRSMKENARQGYWNGARPPFGYQAVEVERRGSRIKKRLVIDPVEAETVRLIFRLFLEGDGRSGPMGVKAIAVWLNTHGFRTRGGATWGFGSLHALLTHSVYAGRMPFNRFEARSGRRKAASEQVVSCARHGRTACKGRSIRMDKLDGLVTTHLADRLLQPERLKALLGSLAGRRAEKAAAVDASETAGAGGVRGRRAPAPALQAGRGGGDRPRRPAGRPHRRPQGRSRPCPRPPGSGRARPCARRWTSAPSSSSGSERPCASG